MERPYSSLIECWDDRLDNFPPFEGKQFLIP